MEYTLENFGFVVIHAVAWIFWCYNIKQSYNYYAQMLTLRTQATDQNRVCFLTFLKC